MCTLYVYMETKEFDISHVHTALFTYPEWKQELEAFSVVLFNI